MVVFSYEDTLYSWLDFLSWFNLYGSNCDLSRTKSVIGILDHFRREPHFFQEGLVFLSDKYIPSTPTIFDNKCLRLPDCNGASRYSISGILIGILAVSTFILCFFYDFILINGSYNRRRGLSWFLISNRSVFVP